VKFRNESKFDYGIFIEKEDEKTAKVASFFIIEHLKSFLLLVQTRECFQVFSIASISFSPLLFIIYLHIFQDCGCAVKNEKKKKRQQKIFFMFSTFFSLNSDYLQASKREGLRKAKT
jgi:hypothetical protein